MAALQQTPFQSKSASVALSPPQPHCFTRCSPASFIMRSCGTRSLVWPGRHLCYRGFTHQAATTAATAAVMSVDGRSRCLYLYPYLSLHRYFGCLCTYLLKKPNGWTVEKKIWNLKKKNILQTSCKSILQGLFPNHFLDIVPCSLCVSGRPASCEGAVDLDHFNSLRSIQ